MRQTKVPKSRSSERFVSSPRLLGMDQMRAATDIKNPLKSLKDYGNVGDWDLIAGQGVQNDRDTRWPQYSKRAQEDRGPSLTRKMRLITSPMGEGTAGGGRACHKIKKRGRKAATVS